MADPLVDTWLIHDRIHGYLLDAIPAAQLGGIAPTKGRSVAQVFAHIHNVRLMWLASAGVEAPAGAAKIDLDDALTVAGLKKSLNASAKGITSVIENGLAAGGKVKGFKPHVHAFVGYLIAHESHHRGQVLVTLKANGAALDKKISYGIWEWGVR
jgi:uncharacterized damage-inducible protein DinB